MISPKPGDVVCHRPSGESWLVAIADPSRDELVACGWPCSIEKLSDCDIAEECSLDESRKLAASLSTLRDDRGGADYRASRVRSLYPELFT
jgi:hypothetical protein